MVADGLPIDLVATRVVDMACRVLELGGGFFCQRRLWGGLSNAIDAARDVWLGELGGGATVAKPAACIDDDEGAVGIFDDVGGMEIGIGGGEKVLAGGGIA